MMEAPREPRITINGVTLTDLQSMTVRVAMGAFLIHLVQEDPGNYDCGVKELNDNYKRVVHEINQLMVTK